MKLAAVIVLICVIITGFLYCLYHSFLFEDNSVEFLKDVTFQVNDIFNKLDINGDGILNVAEFSSLTNYYKIFQYSKEDVSNYEIQEFPLLSTRLDEQIIHIDVAFIPLALNSLKKNISSIAKDELGSIIGLLDWKAPYKNDHPFGSNSFSLFLPKHPKLGVPWWIIEPKLEKYSRPLSSERYFPPVVEEKYQPLFALLSLFHPHPFLWTRFAPQGTAAIIRAIEEDFYDIVFRVHAEFQLNKPPLYPFWFTPSQFSGRLIINKDASVVKYFHMSVPDTKLNVDLEWLDGPTESSMEVDIGYIPKMSLISSLISAVPSTKPGADKEISSIKWNTEISMEAALDSLELFFFPFKEVKYYKMPAAFETAEAESKLVHGIILWGNLDDQSC